MALAYSLLHQNGSLMASTNSKKPLSRHRSIGQKPPTQPSETSVMATSAAIKDRPAFPPRRQTMDSIDSVKRTFRESCSSLPPPPPPPPPPLPVSSSGAADDNDRPKKTNEEEEEKKNRRLFVMEKWLYYGRDEPSSGEGERVEGVGKRSSCVVVEQRRLVETTPIDGGHREVIRRTWPIVADQMNSNGCHIFLRIFELSPGIKRVFGFGPEMSGVEIASHPRLVQHASRFMEAMQVAVEHLDELDTVVAPVFINLGKRHIYFKDINVGYFNVFSGAILFTWRQTFGERFSAEVRSAWSRLFDFIIQHLRFGYELELSDNEARSQDDDKRSS